MDGPDAQTKPSILKADNVWTVNTYVKYSKMESDFKFFVQDLEITEENTYW